VAVGAQPRPRVLQLAAFKVADSTAFYHPGLVMSWRTTTVWAFGSHPASVPARAPTVASSS